MEIINANSNNSMINTDSEIVIVKFKVRGGYVFDAYEPSVNGYASTSHSSLYRIRGGR